MADSQVRVRAETGTLREGSCQTNTSHSERGLQLFITLLSIHPSITSAHKQEKAALCPQTWTVYTLQNTTARIRWVKEKVDALIL